MQTNQFLSASAAARRRAGASASATIRGYQPRYVRSRPQRCEHVNNIIKRQHTRQTGPQPLSPSPAGSPKPGSFLASFHRGWLLLSQQEQAAVSHAETAMSLNQTKRPPP